jgi:hypothetical protein
MTSAAAPAPDQQYTFRLSLFSRTASYRLTDHSLLWSKGNQRGELEYSDIRSIRIYESPGARRLPAFRRCVITPRRGRTQTLSSNHLDGILFESHLKSYQPFVDELLRRVAATNPDVEYIYGFSMALWIAYVALLAVFVLLFLGCGLLAVFLSVDHEVGGAIAMIICALMMFALALLFWPWVRRNRPHRYDPRTKNPLPPRQL